jgi:hypothetical protein
MRTILLAASVLLSLPPGAGAGADGPDYWSVQGVAPDDVLNLRSRPDPHAPVLAGIPPQATCLKNLGCRGGLSFQEFTSLSAVERKAIEKRRPRWCRVVFQDKTGWVSGHYLREARGQCSEPLRSDEESGVEPVHVEGYEVDAGAERSGGDYRRGPAADLQACARRCSEEARCRAFDYFYRQKRCVLKEEVKPVQRNPRVISGVKVLE